MNEGKSVSVWRVELDGVGPYNNKFPELSEELVWAHCIMAEDTHPCAPREFAPHVIDDSHNHYGLLTRAELAAWFKGYGRKLSKLGFQVVEYSVPETHCIIAKSGSGQVAYDARYARQVVTMPVMEAFRV